MDTRERKSREEATAIFRRSSTTFFNSALFFPPEVRRQVTALYAFVRTADDFVDNMPQDGEGFRAFRERYEGARRGADAEPVVRDMAALERECPFKPEWADAFLDAMGQDLWKREYATLEETTAYTYGSAEVIGLMMCRIMGVSDAVCEEARLLGRGFQYINFVRDVQDDLERGRTYLPADEWRGQGLAALTAAEASRSGEAFREFMRGQVRRFREFQRDGMAGFRAIPYRYRIALKTACDAFEDTAKTIEREPEVVFRRQVKPSRRRVVWFALTNALTGAGAPRGTRVGAVHRRGG